jgi:hypothetical protein
MHLPQKHSGLADMRHILVIVYLPDWQKDQIQAGSLTFPKRHVVMPYSASTQTPFGFAGIRNEVLFPWDVGHADPNTSAYGPFPNHFGHFITWFRMAATHMAILEY